MWLIRLAVVVAVGFGWAGSVLADGPVPSAQDVLDAYLSDSFVQAEAKALRLMKLHPEKPESYRVLASIAAHGRRFDDLEAIVERGRQVLGDVPVMASIEAEVALLRGQARQARQRLERAVEQHPEEPSLLIDLAALVAVSGDPQRAAAILDEVMHSEQSLCSLEELAVAAVLSLIPARLDEALSIISQYRRKQGDSSLLLITEALLHLRSGEPGRTISLLSIAFERNPYLLNEILMVSPLLVGLGQAALALEALERSMRLHPGVPEAERAVVDLRRRVEDEAQVTRREFGRVIIDIDPDLPSSVVEKLNLQLRRAIVLTESWFGMDIGEVQVLVVRDTGLGAPAYYDSVHDRVVIAPVDIEDAVALRGIMPVLRHELGHLALFRLLDEEGTCRWNNRLPLWFIEGVAECAAGRVHLARHRRGRQPLGGDELLLGLSLASIGRPGSHRAYAQATLMVDVLLGARQPEQRRERMGLFVRTLDEGMNVDDAMMRAFDLSMKEVVARVFDIPMESKSSTSTSTEWGVPTYGGHDR